MTSSSAKARRTRDRGGRDAGDRARLPSQVARGGRGCPNRKSNTASVQAEAAGQQRANQAVPEDGKEIRAGTNAEAYDVGHGEAPERRDRRADHRNQNHRIEQRKPSLKTHRSWRRTLDRIPKHHHFCSLDHR